MLEPVPNKELTDDDEARRRLLVAALEAVGVNQSELGRRLDVDVTSINRWCNGRAVFRQARWFAVAAALGLPVDWKPAAADHT